LESNDPRSLAEWTRRMSHATGEEMGPEHEDIIGKLESGEPIDQVMAEVEPMMADTGGEEN